jgi:hypothetical protein
MVDRPTLNIRTASGNQDAVRTEEKIARILQKWE